MSKPSSYLAEKIDALENKFKVENEKDKDKISREYNGGLDAPRAGSGRRPRHCKYLLSLPWIVLYCFMHINIYFLLNYLKIILQIIGILAINPKF